MMAQEVWEFAAEKYSSHELAHSRKSANAHGREEIVIYILLPLRI